MAATFNFTIFSPRLLRASPFLQLGCYCVDINFSLNVNIIMAIAYHNKAGIKYGTQSIVVSNYFEYFGVLLYECRLIFNKPNQEIILLM